MKQSEHINEFALAFSKAQGMMKAAEKDAKNPFFKSHYATLASVIEAIRVPFSQNGLSFTQPCSINENGIVVETILLHSSGQYIQSEISCKALKPDPQTLGSIISYLKRYLLQAMVGIASADDDGESAMGRPLPIVQPQKVNPPRPIQDPLFVKISEIIKVKTDGFNKEKLALLLKELKVVDSAEIKKMSEEEKMEIISILESKQC